MESITRNDTFITDDDADTAMDGFVRRTEYLEILNGYRKNRPVIKVITGVRRCGKSVLLEQFRELLLEDGVPEDEIIQLNLDEKRYVIDSERGMYDHLRKAIASKGPYVLIDEVQLIRGWERVVDTIRRKTDANIYITGSNSETVSSDLGTHLTGRFVEIHMLPFSFREFVDRYPVDGNTGYTGRLRQYLRYGGFPLIDLRDDDVKNRAILRGLYNSILNEDIRSKLDVSQTKIENMTSFMMSNVGNQTSAGRIGRRAGISDQRTVERYLERLRACYMFYRAENYDIIGGGHLATTGKYYAVDTGLRNVMLKGSEYNEAALLENAVYLELMRRGYDVSVGSYKDSEIDFTAWSGGEVSYYQVSLDIGKDDTLRREMRSLSEIGGKRFLITMSDDVAGVPEGVETLRATDFLLGG